MILICSASRICSFCLLFWCSIIVVLSVRIFRNCVVGHECFFKCWAIELGSEMCIVSLLDRVVEVKPTYILLFSEIQSPKGHLNWYITLFFFFKTPYIYIYIYMYIYIQEKLATIVGGDQKAPFSTATTPRCRRGHYSFPWIAPLYPWYIPYIAEC